MHVKPPKELILVAHDAASNELVEGIEAALETRDPATGEWLPIDSCTTNRLGCAGFRVPKPYRRTCRNDSVLRIRFREPSAHTIRTIPANGYRNLFETTVSAGSERPGKAKPVADMHYHISLRAQNRFGQDFHPDPNDPSDPRHPAKDAIWYKSVRKLKARVDGRWMHFNKVDWKRIRSAGRQPIRSRAYRKYESLLLGQVRPANANNRLDNYTQATHPHTRSGQVRLGFNAISPFESNLANTSRKRFVSSVAKSGADAHWLRRIGGSRQQGRLTHWENFLSEHRMMREQDPTIERLDWQFLRDGRELATASDSVTYVVNVIEGGHALQHRLFPNEVDYDMSNRTEKENKALLKYYDELRKDPALDAGTRAALARLDPGQTRLRLNKEAMDDSSGLLGWSRRAVVDSMERVQLRELSELSLTVDDLLEDELERNLRQLKALDPPVHMMTIAHLSYNGMLGHSPALDDGTFIGRLVARRVYAIRVSEDPQYQNQWKGLFFTVPGVNRFGSSLMHGLVDTLNGRRILIDLKHSDPMVRRYFYDSLMTDRVPPICSHCAVNGMPLDFWSPFNDEYALLRAPFSTHLYPFGINLYNEEIKYIRRHGGIIGLTLEHRVLGGYINKLNHYDFRVNRKGRQITPGPRRRFNHDRFMLRWLSDRSPDRRLLDPALEYTRNELGVPERRVLRTVTDDYKSVEPVLRNLFLIIDTIKVDARSLDGITDPSYPWGFICLGSDLDGVIDPIDICPTADQFPLLRDRLRQFIPVFLHLRFKEADAIHSTGEVLPFEYSDYFTAQFSIDDALDALFYRSLREFTFNKIRP